MLSPVTNTGGTETETYAGAAMDLSALSSLFTVDTNAGAGAYTVEAGGTGTGSIGADDKTRTITKAGTFNIGLTTAATATHAEGAKVTATLTVNKGTKAAPVGLGKTDLTTIGGSDGKITGLTPNTAYQYKKDSGAYTAAISNASGEITSLSAGSYVVRFAETDLYNASADSDPLVIGQPSVPTVKSVTVSPGTASVYKGGTQQFTAAVDVTGGAARTVAWSVSGGTDSIIDSTGKLSVGMNEKAATLTVTATSTVDSTKKDTATVTVTKYGTPYPVRRGFSVFMGSGDCSTTIDADYSKFLRLLVDGAELDTSNYTVTEGSTIITLKESYLKTLANGDYRVMAMFTDGQADTNLVINVPVNATGVTLDKTTANVTVGKTVQLTATISPDDATDKGVTWKSSDASIATVNENGLVKGVKAVKATITVTTDDGGYTATCDVTVTGSSTAPQTGDSNDIMLWVILGLSSILAGTGLFVLRKRQQNA